MSTSDRFEQESLGWQVQMLQRRVSQWWEFQQNRFADRIPEYSLPFNLDWIDWGLLWGVIQIAGVCLAGWLLLRLGWLLGRRLHLLLVREFPQSGYFSPSSNREEMSVQGWVKRSQLLQRERRYREACICLYFAVIRQLHDSGIVPNSLSRTDGEYLQLLRNFPQNDAYETLLTIHQKVCFASGEVSSADFDRCQDAYRAIAEALKTVGKK
ncbi:MAG: DUF4129 domain-containing protein [Limnospira sp.]